MEIPTNIAEDLNTYEAACLAKKPEILRTLAAAELPQQLDVSDMCIELPRVVASPLLAMLRDELNADVLPLSEGPSDVAYCNLIRAYALAVLQGEVARQMLTLAEPDAQPLKQAQAYVAEIDLQARVEDLRCVTFDATSLLYPELDRTLQGLAGWLCQLVDVESDDDETMLFHTHQMIWGGRNYMYNLFNKEMYA